MTETFPEEPIMKKKLVALLLILGLLLVGTAQADYYAIDKKNGTNFGMLLIDLLHAYEKPAADDQQVIARSLEKIRDVNLSDYEVARAIVDHWSRVYLNSEGEYVLNMHDGGQRAASLEATGLQDSAQHAFVVLGYELKDGKMAPELVGRCEAAAAAARSFPSAILVCSGGATGKNNPKNHTEAGMMKQYLVEVCGIDANRVFIDEKALNTAQNAINTFEIMRDHDIRTFTVVTSSYHQRWGQVIYNAMAALYRLSYGYDAALVENYCYPIEAYGNYKRDDRFAIRQLTAVLRLSDKVVEQMRKAF